MTNLQETGKRAAAASALRFVEPHGIIGVGTGSTVNFFLEALAGRRIPLRGAVSSSQASSARLKAIGVEVLDLNAVDGLAIYVDGADEATRDHHLIKGGGGALTREKIIAAASRHFVCIVDESKLVEKLGRFPLPVEVVPMAREYAARELRARGGRPVWRQDFVTDNGNHILDVHDLAIGEPVLLERELNQIAGVVCVGLFAQRPADLLLVGHAAGVEEI